MKLLQKLKQFKKLNTSGFSHHLVLPVIVVLAVASIGVKVVLSQAYTVKVPAQYVVAPSTENGCWLSGRKWDSTKKDCLQADVGTSHSCRNAKTTLKSVKDTDGKVRFYCTGAVALESAVSQDKCVNQFHRMFIKYIGCARIVSQDNTNGARQCIGNNVPATDPLAKYKNYVAETDADHCVAPTIANPGGGGTSPTEDALDKTTCNRLGRVVDTANSKCKQACQANAGTLLVGSDAAKTKYCSAAVAPSVIQTRCAQLHRVWVAPGCTRRADQKDNANDALHCVSGYPYYNANSSASTGGTLDVCEPNKTTSDSHESDGIIGGVVVCKGGQVTNGKCVCPAGQVLHEGTCQTSTGGNNGDNDGGSTGSGGGSGGDANATDRIILFKDKDFKGDSLTVSATVSADESSVSYQIAQGKQAAKSVKSLATMPKGWDNQVSSYKILKGHWKLCVDKNYQANCIKPWASDPNMGDVADKANNLNNKISSLRPLTTRDFNTVETAIPSCLDASGTPVETDASGNCPVGSTLTCPDDPEGIGYILRNGECGEVAVSLNTGVPVDKSFTGKNGERNCDLLGREWIAKQAGKTINGGQYGCSIVTCASNKDGRPHRVLYDGQDKDAKTTDTVCVSYLRDAPYAVKLGSTPKESKKRCDDLHRIWVEQVRLCAQVPNRKDKDQTIVNAKQCVGDHKVYYIFKASQKNDECFNPSYFQRAKSVAKSTGGALNAALQQGPKAYCSVVKHKNYHWDKHANKCVIDRKPCWNGKSIPVNQQCPQQPTTPDTTTPDDGAPPPPGTNWNVFCGNLHRVAQSNGCGDCDNTHPVRISVRLPGWDKCTGCPAGQYPQGGNCRGASDHNTGGDNNYGSGPYTTKEVQCSSYWLDKLVIGNHIRCYKGAGDNCYYNSYIHTTGPPRLDSYTDVISGGYIYRVLNVCDK